LATSLPLALHSGLTISRLVGLVPLALLVAAAYSIYFFVLSHGQVAITGAVMACYPAVTIALSVGFLGERISFPELVGMVGILIGAVLLLVPEKAVIRSSREWVVWGSGGAILLGIADF